MANDGINTVPLGQAGTGSAYLLPESQAIQQASNYIDQSRISRLRAEQLRQQQAQQLAAAWQQNQLNIKGGTLFQPEINNRAAKVMQMGLDLQKAGVNPNTISTDPQTQQLLETYKQQKASLLRDVDARDAISKQAGDYEKLLAAHPDGYFDNKSVQDYHDYIGGKTSLADITGQGLQMPALKAAFNLQPLVDKMQGVPIETKSVSRSGVERKMKLPNEEAHLQLANGLINNNPEVQADIERKAGLPFDQIGNQTNPDKIKKQLDDYWRSKPNIGQLAQMGITSYNDPRYDQLVTTQAKRMANAAKVKADYIDNIKTTLDNKVHKEDDQGYNFEYQDQQMQRERLGMERERFADWKAKQQEEGGTFNLGNQDSYVPVIKQMVSNSTRQAGRSLVQAEPGASLYGVNLPAVSAVVRPSLITNMKTGRTTKNTGAIDVKVSQIQMVPVFKDLSKDDSRNGSEISARQMKEIVEGRSKFAKLNNITFQPFAYGIKSEKDGDNVHTVNTPIKFSYDALKGGDAKKIKTTTFDEATEGLKMLQSNPKFQQMSPQDQLDFISKKYNVKLD